MTKIDLYAKYGSDRNKEQKGVPFYIDEETNTYITVARWTVRNVEHTKAQAELSLRMADASEADREDASMEIFVRHLITGWNNITDKDGNDLEFTPDNAVALIRDLPDLGNILLNFALKRENYGLDSVEKATKNS